MFVEINGAKLNVEVMGKEDGKPVLIAHHGGGGIGSLAEPKKTYGPLSDIFQVVVFDARGCGNSEIVGPYSHEQWAADVDGLRKWMGVDKIVVAGGSYGGFISLEYAVRYPDHTEGILLRDTSADNNNFSTLEEKARAQDRVEVNWDNFHRYWNGEIRDDADLKACWAELIPMYDFEYDPVKSNAAVEAGFYHHAAHNYCFTHNKPNYDLKPVLHSIKAPTLINVGRTDWVTPVESSQIIADGVPNSRLVIYEKSGHSPQFEEYDLFQEVQRKFIADYLPHLLPKTIA